jgi:putative ABC transport system ATP-binding protein
MIHIEQLTFQYPDGPFRMKVPALTVPTGSSLALTGRSGCGKSTLIRLIAGIEPPTSGQITIDGEDLTTQSDVQRRTFRAAHIGLVFQDFQLLDYLNAWENIILPYRLTAALTLTPQTLDRGKEAAHQCGIDHLLRRRIDRLSHGERQRVAICRAIVADPRILLCDEPSGSLDPDTAESIVDLLQSIVTDRGVTMIMVTHDALLAQRLQSTIDWTALEATP